MQFTSSMLLDLDFLSYVLIGHTSIYGRMFLLLSHTNCRSSPSQSVSYSHFSLYDIVLSYILPLSPTSFFTFLYTAEYVDISIFLQWACISRSCMFNIACFIFLLSTSVSSDNRPHVTSGPSPYPMLFSYLGSILSTSHLTCLAWVLLN